MREILFRGECTETGDWVKGFYVRLYDSKGNESHRIYPGYAETDCGNYYPDWYEVDSEKVDPFTGREDANKRKVFENDILQLYTVWADGTREKSGVAVVKWRNNDQCYVLEIKGGVHCDDFGNLGLPTYYEIIGNIHDNPELLEG